MCPNISVHKSRQTDDQVWQNFIQSDKIFMEFRL